MLACSFHRAGRSHAFLLVVDHVACDAAEGIVLLDGDQLDQALDMARANGSEHGLLVSEEVLDPSEFRWQAEIALDARAVHDADDDLDVPADPEPLDDDDEPPYPVMAALLRARLTTLPESSKPKPQHGQAAESPPDGLAAFVADAGKRLGQRPPIGRSKPAVLPMKRQRSDGPAPVYQIKVSLRGAQPPIWRRLEVSSDITLARLHTVLQLAFDWYDDHLHVFETPYGAFGAPDPDLGHRAATRVTLEQVAPDVKAKIGYTYDFGDNWSHEIVVEKVLDGDETATYARCTDGRRAAPPEDCGGIWGYSDLIEALADPTHPEHEDRLDWLGLTSPADFDPARFDADAVNRALAGLA